MYLEKEEMYSLIMELGNILTEYNHQWSDELRSKFEKIISILSSH